MKKNLLFICLLSALYFPVSGQSKYKALIMGGTTQQNIVLRMNAEKEYLEEISLGLNIEILPVSKTKFISTGVYISINRYMVPLARVQEEWSEGPEEIFEITRPSTDDYNLGVSFFREENLGYNFKLLYSINTGISLTYRSPINLIHYPFDPINAGYEQADIKLSPAGILSTYGYFITPKICLGYNPRKVEILKEMTIYFGINTHWRDAIAYSNQEILLSPQNELLATKVRERMSIWTVGLNLGVYMDMF